LEVDVKPWVTRLVPLKGGFGGAQVQRVEGAYDLHGQSRSATFVLKRPAGHEALALRALVSFAGEYALPLKITDPLGAGPGGDVVGS
jgi:hypothetical protein